MCCCYWSAHPLPHSCLCQYFTRSCQIWHYVIFLACWCVQLRFCFLFVFWLSSILKPIAVLNDFYLISFFPVSFTVAHCNICSVKEEFCSRHLRIQSEAAFCQTQSLWSELLYLLVCWLNDRPQHKALRGVLLTFGLFHLFLDCCWGCWVHVWLKRTVFCDWQASTVFSLC